jgi:hypothetical protein
MRDTYPTPEARGLLDHILRKAAHAREKYGGEIDTAAVLHILEDREIVHYPVAIRFEAWHLEPDELAYLEQLGEHPDEGFLLFMHPALEAHHELWPAVIAFHLPAVNYGDAITHDEARQYAATLLGIAADTLTAALEQLAESLPHHGHHAPHGVPA